MNLAVRLVNDLATVLDLYALCILVWAFLTFFPGGSASTVGRLLDRLVLPVIRPLRRVLPTLAGVDFSPVLAMVIVYAVAEALQQLASAAFVNPVGAVVGVAFSFIDAVLLVMLVLMLIRVLIGFLHADPWHPFVSAVGSITDTIVYPIRRTLGSRVEVAAVLGFGLVLVVYVGLAQFLFPAIQSGIG